MKVLKKNKRMNIKGQVGLDTAKSVMLTLLVVAVIAFAIIVALANLNTSNALTSGTLEANQTTDVLQNVSGGITDFFANAGTWFSLLAVVIIILIIAIVIFAVNRFGRSGGGL